MTSSLTGVREYRPRAFTLIELLVVINILANLAVRLLPALSKAKDRAQLANDLDGGRAFPRGSLDGQMRAPDSAAFA